MIFSTNTIDYQHVTTLWQRCNIVFYSFFATI